MDYCGKDNHRGDTNDPCLEMKSHPGQAAPHENQAHRHAHALITEVFSLQGDLWDGGQRIDYHVHHEQTGHPPCDPNKSQGCMNPKWDIPAYDSTDANE